MTVYTQLAQKKFERKKSSSGQKSPYHWAMPWLYLTVFQEITFIFWFLLFWLSVNKNNNNWNDLVNRELQQKSERIIKRKPKEKRTSSLWCLVPAKPFFFPQVNMQGITKLGFTFFGFRRLLSLISMEVRFGPTRKI